MKQYGYLQAIFMSFYSRNLYRDVAKNWGGGVFLYLLLLLVICWALLMFRMQPVINQSAEHFANTIVVQLPESINIEKGSAKTAENRPYPIKDPDTHKTVVMIDTSGKYTDLQQTEAQILMTKDTLIYSDNNAIKIQKIPVDIKLSIKPEYIKEFAVKFAGWSWIFLFPIFLIGSFLYRFIESLFYAVLGKVFALLTNIEISYIVITKLALVALTPAIVISTLVEWYGHWPHNHVLFYFVLSMAYLMFAIGAVRENKL
jgi:hypothetical protein